MPLQYGDMPHSYELEVVCQQERVRGDQRIRDYNPLLLLGARFEENQIGAVYSHDEFGGCDVWAVCG